MPSSGSTLVAGMAMYSANAPSRSTPMMRVFLQMWLLPVRHWRQCPHTMWPSAVTSCPVRSSATAPPTATISPANSCPTTSGGRRRPSAQAFQSAMCRSVPHTPACRTTVPKPSPGPGEVLIAVRHAGDEHLTRAGRRFGHRRDLEAGGALLFDDRLHARWDENPGPPARGQPSEPDSARLTPGRCPGVHGKRETLEDRPREAPVDLQRGAGNITGALR